MNSFFEVSSYGISDQGLIRKNNEDVWGSLPSQNFFVLADGMGGHNAGEIAAREAVDSLVTHVKNIFSSSRKENKHPEHLAKHLQYAIQDTNCLIKEMACTHSAYSGMGTTLCCILLHKNQLIYANVGDSRIYRYRQSLDQISEDHSLKNHLLKKGKLTPENMERYPYKNRLTKALGTQSHIVPDIGFLDVFSGDIFFLCSDGLTDHLSDAEITQIINATSCIEEIANTLINEAKLKGGKDNITVVMVKLIEKNQ
ncbi:MAG: Stp1/IreP family PP2C-type Ser/Thr phosphatase [Chlamydiae bacterium]|nr:Stp1/IreP family PP2C-type Ser/Thr phosphatase [Chlamydiota bacterium]